MTDHFSHGYALIIGVDQNSVPTWALPAVAHDVEALHDVLIHPQRCAYAEAQVKLIRGTEATRGNILAGFDWLQARLAEDAAATAVIYYSGHGWRDEQTQPPQYYLIPYDVRRERLRSSALRAAELAEAIDALQPARLLVVLDCCHAGGMGVKDLAASYTPAAAPLDIIMPRDGSLAKEIDNGGLAQLTQGEGRAVLTSSRAEQPSYLSSKAQMSIFTYHLIEALTGSAQPKEGAQEVLVSDLLSHVYRHVPATARQEVGAEQQPDGRLTGNFAVALLLGGKGLAAGATPPDPVEPLPAAVTTVPLASTHAGSNIQIGKIEAVNVATGNQIIDQRGATIQVGGRTTSKTDGER
ncbi:MAG: caspase family protein [Caldilineaceae bacterium]